MIRIDQTQLRGHLQQLVRESAELPAVLEGPQAEGREAGRFGQVPGASGSLGRVLSRGALAAVHGALVSQRVHRNAARAARGSGGHAQDDHGQEDRPAAREMAVAVAEKLEAVKLRQAAAIVREGVDDMLSCMSFPREHWTRVRTNNMLDRIIREIRRRTRVVENFPDGHSAVMLVAARLRHVVGTRWCTRQYMDMERLREQDQEEKTISVAKSFIPASP